MNVPDTAITHVIDNTIYLDNDFLSWLYQLIGDVYFLLSAQTVIFVLILGALCFIAFRMR